jgi:hypothetical protein
MQEYSKNCHQGSTPRLPRQSSHWRHPKIAAWRVSLFEKYELGLKPKTVYELVPEFFRSFES